ncbi:hypothetical protein J2X69_000053 [Algoriphagus sp. 4150]|uniref:hypothetical protein n=1 Tax=Algoriphagus sp. 4150 TaxID=2817756 RepID=UPI00286560F6|nr:hypothetical protein [Algoriphagus sp. 4150]MDR7127725.1 hypothetical protein [Algoriphagus sp. 4150]
MRIRNIYKNLGKVNSFLREDPFLRKYFVHWICSLINFPFTRKYPWLTYGAISWLKKNVQEDWNILEFGSGSSTVFFAKHCQFVTSFEHDNSWRELVLQQLGQKGFINVKILPYSAVYQDEYLYFKDPKVNLILLDGIDREITFRYSFPLLSTGSFLILDNAERSDYSNIHLAMEKYPSCTFSGVSPYNMKITTTKIWRIENT